MIERKALSVSLTPELHAFVGDLVATGGYGNASEVVRAGLRLLRHEEAMRRQRTSQDRSDPDVPTARRTRARNGRDARG